MLPLFSLKLYSFIIISCSLGFAVPLFVVGVDESRFQVQLFLIFPTTYKETYVVWRVLSRRAPSAFLSCKMADAGTRQPIGSRPVNIGLLLYIKFLLLKKSH